MTTAAYDIGDLRALGVTFQNAAGSDADPTTITFRLLEPDGTVTVFVYGTDAEVVRDALGQYHVDWTLAQSGRHVARWEGTGAVHASVEDELYARRSDIV
jgi:hypothetical protein